MTQLAPPSTFVTVPTIGPRTGKRLPGIFVFLSVIPA
jgi:hypothetical protein